MAIISRACVLAFHAMARLPERGRAPLALSAIAKALSVSSAHLAKVLQQLARNRLVESTRGPGGGFVLGRNPADVRMRDVYECIGGEQSVEACLFGATRCDGGPCMMGDVVRDMTARFARFLDETRLCDLRHSFNHGIDL